MKNSRRERGITLIALVITIIVLLILAAVSIAILTEENGILTEVTTAKGMTKRETAIEQAKLDILAWQAEKLGKNESAELSDNIIKSILDDEDKKDYVLEVKDTSFITVDGEYEILYSELYKTLSGKGKTISELYDGINDLNDENYNENAMHIGDWVNYTAGEWSETKALPTEDTPFIFGGYTLGQSRDTNANLSNKYGETKYQGWRIWDISEDKKTVTLISAGCPEVYYHQYGTNKGYISEYILTGNINTVVEDLDLGLGDTYSARDWSMYKNEDLYATNVRAMKKDDLDKWYGKYIDNTIIDSSDADFPTNTENKLISTAENGFYYYLSSTLTGSGVWGCDSDIRGLWLDTTGARGVRVLITLSSEVKFNETSEKIESDGFTYNKWIIDSE